MKLNIISLKSAPILEQLRIEEGLLRTSNENFCLINSNATPAIVLGSSCNASDWVHTEKAKAMNVPLIKRMSSGGTVFIDENTLFVTFIIQKSAAQIAPTPQSILKWTESLYQKALPIPLKLRDNDFVINDHKVGGNALYIRKDVWLIHTSFLWDFSPANMALLKHPPKQPTYRKDRTHSDFLTKLKAHMPPNTFKNALKSHLSATFQTIDHTPAPFPKHRQNVAILSA